MLPIVSLQKVELNHVCHFVVTKRDSDSSVKHVG
jgi:hypothetical protein